MLEVFGVKEIKKNVLDFRLLLRTVAVQMLRITTTTTVKTLNVKMLNMN